MRFFHQVGGFRAHAQGTFHFWVCHFPAPSFGLLVEVMPIREGAARKKIVLAISKVSFHFCFSVRIANGMGDKLNPKDLAKTFHLRGNLSIRSTAVSHKGGGAVAQPVG